MVYTESDLVMPALVALRENPSGVKTSRLIKLLEKQLKPTGRDAQILKGRKDSYFSQKVRNLKSHNTLTRQDLATYENSRWKITSKGARFVKENAGIYRALRNQGFSARQLKSEVEREFKKIIIEEGAMEKRPRMQRERSRLLRQVAIRESRRNHGGKLFCEVCGFNFETKYGKRGRDYIEVHHMEPVGGELLFQA